MKIIQEFDLPVPDQRTKTRIIQDSEGYFRIQSHFLIKDAKGNRIPELSGWKDEFKVEDYSDLKSAIVKNISKVIEVSMGIKKTLKKKKKKARA